MHTSSFRSSNLPSYLANAGIRAQQMRVRAAKARASHSNKQALRSGRITRAQFNQSFPNALNHGQGNYEDVETGDIWESREDGYIHRRSEDIRDILQAVNTNPTISEEEYEQLIANFKDETVGGN